MAGGTVNKVKERAEKKRRADIVTDEVIITDERIAHITKKNENVIISYNEREIV